MLAIQSSLALSSYQQEQVDVLRSDDCIVFLDTNLLAWIFRLNDQAVREFFQWLEQLAQNERLIIPAWTVHEYNHYLLRDDSRFFLPHKAVGKQLNANLAELERVARLMISDANAKELGYSNRDTFFSAFSEASKTIQLCVGHLANKAGERRSNLITFLEQLITKCATKSNVHELADAAASEAPARYANRLSPGYSDESKTENASGDLIIWKEIPRPLWVQRCEQGRPHYQRSEA